MTSHSHLGKLIKETRDGHGWSQDQLKDKLHLARPISISKWERGEAPVPVHHWLELMQILGIASEVWVEAAKRDRHKQLGMFTQLHGSVKDSAREIGSFSWDFIARSLAPELTKQLDALRERYQDLSPAEFAVAAWKWFLESSKSGLDRNNRPIVQQDHASSAPRHVVHHKSTRASRQHKAVR